MCTDKSYINPFYRKFYNNHQTMVVATNIKHIMLITNIVHTIETSFHICEIVPIGSFDYTKPIL